MAELKVWEDDPALYLFTSLTAGSSHIITATSRIETILKNARIPFSYIDTATNESAKKLFQRRARGKKLPLLVKEGFVIGDLEQVEEWNEFGELKEAIGDVATVATSVTTTPAKIGPPSASQPITLHGTPSKPAAVTASASAGGAPPFQQENVPTSSQSAAVAQIAKEAASAAKDKKATPAPLTSTTNTASTATPSSATTSSKDKETPLSPSSVPLPSTPALTSPLPPASPRVASPTPSIHGQGTSHHHRHSSTGSTHSYVPERVEPPPVVHRGSNLSIASEEDIKKIENDETIMEEDEGEEDAGCVSGVKKGKAEEDADAKKLAEGVGKVKIEDQEPAEGKHATASVED